MRFDIGHRDALASLEIMEMSGGVDLIITSPPYPDARRSHYNIGEGEFPATRESYVNLGRRVFNALRQGGVCVLVIDGPIRVWRDDIGESERSPISAQVQLDWMFEIGFRLLDHGAYCRQSTPISGGSENPRFRSGFEPYFVFCRPGERPYFDRWGYTIPAVSEGRVSGGRHRRGGGWGTHRPTIQGSHRCLTTAELWSVNQRTTDRDHPAPFSSEFSDAHVLCYSPLGGTVGDPFVGSGTVAISCLNYGRSFIGGDIGHRESDGRRWADIVKDRVSQNGLFDMVGVEI